MFIKEIYYQFWKIKKIKRFYFLIENQLNHETSFRNLNRKFVSKNIINRYKVMLNLKVFFQVVVCKIKMIQIISENVLKLKKNIIKARWIYFNALITKKMKYSFLNFRRLHQNNQVVTSKSNHHRRLGMSNQKHMDCSNMDLESGIMIV